MADSTSHIEPEVVRLATRIFEHKLEVKEVMEAAGLTRALWYRWRGGGDPRVSQIRNVDRAIDRLIAEKELPHGAQDRTQDTSPGGGPAER